MQVNLSKTALGNFLDLLNLDNPSAPVPFTEQNISVGVPEDNIGMGNVLLQALAPIGGSGLTRSAIIQIGSGEPKIDGLGSVGISMRGELATVSVNGGQLSALNTFMSLSKVLAVGSRTYFFSQITKAPVEIEGQVTGEFVFVSEPGPLPAGGTASVVAFGEEGIAAKNTKVLLSAIANQGYSGTKTVKYSRLNLTGGVAELPYAIVVEPTDSAEQIRDKMAAQLGILKSEVLIEALVNGETVMSIEDLVSGGHLPVNEDDDSVQLSAWVNLPSLIYMLDDAVQVRLRVPDTDISLETAIVNDELSGFDPVV